MESTDPREVGKWKPTRDELNDWLREQELCVFSSLDANGAPMSATVSFSVTLDGDLMIGTDETSRKSQNVDRDSRVAITVTDPVRRVTMQLQGNAEKIPQEVFEEKYAEEHYRLRPKSLPFKDVPGQCHILIKPTHIKFSDVRGFPWVVTEFSETA